MTGMNETIYENNRRLLSLNYPRIVKQLDEHEKTGLSVQVAPSGEDSPTMSVRKNDRTFLLHSRYRPLREAGCWAKAINLHDQAVIVLFGFGLGYHVLEIMKSLQEQNRLIVYEPSVDIFAEAVKHTDLHEIIECDGIVLLVGSDGEEITSVMEFCISWSSLDKTVVRCLTNYQVIFQDEYTAFIKAISEVIRKFRILKNTVIVFARDWQINLFKNIPYAVKSHAVNDLHDSFRGKPAVIVSAGPSLNKNVRLLGEIGERAVIICVDTALKVLLRENIRPHFIVTIDGSLVNYEKFKDVKYDGIPLVYTPKCYYEILKSHTGEKVIFSSNDTYIQSLFERAGIQLDNLDTGGSVSNNACSLAVKMGADPVIFIGQDLAFTNDLSHANGSMYDGKNGVDDDEQFMWVEGTDGKTVKTNAMFYVFKRWFEKTIKEDDSERVYINATEGGAKIEGMETATFRETIGRHCAADISVSGKIKSIFAADGSREKINTDEIITEYEESIRELDNISSGCRKGSELSMRLFNLYNTAGSFAVDPILKQLDRIDKEIKKKKEKFKLIEYIIQPVLFATNDYLGTREFGSEREKGMHVAKTSKTLYDGMLGAIEMVKPWIKECIIELRELSLAAGGDMNGLEG